MISLFSVHDEGDHYARLKYSHEWLWLGHPRLRENYFLEILVPVRTQIHSQTPKELVALYEFFGSGQGGDAIQSVISTCEVNGCQPDQIPLSHSEIQIPRRPRKVVSMEFHQRNTNRLIRCPQRGELKILALS